MKVTVRDWLPTAAWISACCAIAGLNWVSNAVGTVYVLGSLAVLPPVGALANRLLWDFDPGSRNARILRTVAFVGLSYFVILMPATVALGFSLQLYFYLSGDPLFPDLLPRDLSPRVSWWAFALVMAVPLLLFTLRLSYWVKHGGQPVRRPRN